MVNLGQKLVGCHTSENIGVIKDVIYKVKQVNRDELQFRVEGVTHWFDFSDAHGIWFDEVKETPKENKSEHQKLTDLANSIELWVLDENGSVKNKHVLMDKEQEKYDYINPNHYKQGSKEVIEMMKLIWGKEKLIAYCEMNAFKYRMRLGLKPEQSVERDLEKANWYEQKAKELRG